MKLLKVHTGESGRGRAATVACHADALLYNDAQGGSYAYTPRYRAPGFIYAMSLIGPETTLRAIAAGCSLPKHHDRTTLHFTGSNDEWSGKWVGRWSCEARVLTTGVMHMVAMPSVSAVKDLDNKGMVQHVIIPNGTDVHQAIYERLLVAYTTPLVPLNLAGQSDEETAAAKVWMEKLCSRIVGEPAAWQTLKPHPDQTDTTWDGSGLLRITQKQLDALVSDLVARRHLTIPPSRRAAWAA